MTIDPWHILYALIMLAAAIVIGQYLATLKNPDNGECGPECKGHQPTKRVLDHDKPPKGGGSGR